LAKHTTVGICIDGNSLNSARILLVCEESKDLNKASYRWSLPGGKCCSLKRGDTSEICCSETAEQTIVREFKEETGYEINKPKLFFSKHENFPSGEFDRHVFIVDIACGKPHGRKVFNHETPKWFSLRDMPRNLFSLHRNMIRDFVLRSLASKAS
jgi:8-oxo-dGTP pyrophosphatase MutT (NUDIX family)